jgi:hypothetical protein
VTKRQAVRAIVIGLGLLVLGSLIFCVLLWGVDLFFGFR